MNKYLKFNQTLIVLLLVVLYSCESKTDVAPVLTSITIETPPNKIAYFEGYQDLNLEGLSVALRYDNGNKTIVEYNDFADYSIVTTPTNGETMPIGTLYFEVIEELSGVSVRQAISVDEKKLSKLELSTLPNKIAYYLGEEFVLEGLKIKMIYNNSEEEEINLSEMESYKISCSFIEGDILNDFYTEIELIHTDTYVSVTLPIEFNTVQDIDGNTYPLTKIGNQIWMAENLRTTTFNDGETIQHIEPNERSTTWLDLEMPTYDWKNTEQDAIDNKLGAYYNYFTVETEKLCPSGWHVPSVSEWQTLTNYLSTNGYEGKEAEPLKSTEDWLNRSWDPDKVGTNIYGFDAIATGFLAAGGLTILYDDAPNGRGDTYTNYKVFSYWWSSTQDANGNVKLCRMYGGDNDINFPTTDQHTRYKLQAGMSVRCLKD